MLENGVQQNLLENGAQQNLLENGVQQNLLENGVQQNLLENGVDHPVCYFSKKFNASRMNYSTIEKERRSLILAVQHFKVYLTSSSLPIILFSDHNPLTFINKMKNNNQRLMRWCLMNKNTTVS